MTYLTISNQALWGAPGRYCYHDASGPLIERDADGNWRSLTVCGLTHTLQRRNEGGRYTDSPIDWPYVSRSIADLIGRPCTRCFGR